MSYSEVEILNGDSNSQLTPNTKIVLDALLPGRNYSLSVQAVSGGMESNETTVYQATRESISLNRVFLLMQKINEKAKRLFNDFL